MSVREAFDRHAEVYDERFSRVALAQEIRADVWRIADAVFSPGARLLDLGCGTGEDAIHFAQNGCRVTAIDTFIRWDSGWPMLFAADSTDLTDFNPLNPLNPWLNSARGAQ